MAWPSIGGGGGDRGEKLTGSGGALTPHPCAEMDTHLVIQTLEDAGKRRSTREGEEGHKGDRGIRASKTWGLSWTWVQEDCGKGGVNRQGTTADAGTLHGAQRRAAEDGGGWGWTSSRWTAFHSGRGGGERVRQRVLL